jgi:hypothetical protein
MCRYQDGGLFDQLEFAVDMDAPVAAVQGVRETRSLTFTAVQGVRIGFVSHRKYCARRCKVSRNTLT